MDVRVSPALYHATYDLGFVADAGAAEQLEAPGEEDHVMEEAAEFIPACVAAIDAYWREKRPKQISMPLTAGPPSQPVQTSRKIGRNDPCSCGSGKKFKKCCGNAA
jgi:uncharacterized protein